MTDVTIYCNGATVTGCLTELVAGKPGADRQMLRVLLAVAGPDAGARVLELQAAAGMATEMTERAALVLLAGLAEAEIRRLDVDHTAWERGCEESEANARRRDELIQAQALIRGLLL